MILDSGYYNGASLTSQKFKIMIFHEKNGKINFKASALWADFFYKLKCLSVCMSVCPSVCLCVHF